MGRIFVLDEDGIEALLRTARVGRIACCPHDAERPYLVPIPYGYDDGSVYSISGPGRKLDLMRRQPAVAFEVDDVEAEDRWRSVAAQAVVYRIRLTCRSGRFEVPDEEAYLYE